MEHRVYDSALQNGIYTLPNHYGHVEDTEVFFANEKTYMVVTESGELVFENEHRQELAKTTVTPDTKTKKHDNVYCKAECGAICVWFPVVEYVDNYPHCDGEYDRWSTSYVAYDCVKFDVAAHTVEQSVTKTCE